MFVLVPLFAALVRLRYAAPTADILAELYMVGYVAFAAYTGRDRSADDAASLF